MSFDGFSFLFFFYMLCDYFHYELCAYDSIFLALNFVCKLSLNRQ